jgi:hypothetical protein
MARSSRRIWTADEAMAALDAARDQQIATIFGRRNPGMVVWGVRFGDMEKIAKQIAPDAGLAAALWESGVFEARTLALRVLPKGALTEEQIDTWVADLNFPSLCDEFAGAVYHTLFARKKMEAWIDDDRDFVKRAGYALLYGFAADPAAAISEAEWLAWLDRIEREIHQSACVTRPSTNRPWPPHAPTARSKFFTAITPTARFRTRWLSCRTRVRRSKGIRQRGGGRAFARCPGLKPPGSMTTSRWGSALTRR